MTCSPYSLKSFPVGLTFPITSEVYTSVKQPLLFDFQWSPRTTGAKFTSSQNGIIDEPTTSTVRYGGKTYRLNSVQITDPTHKQWIIPQSAQQNNYEDIILTFINETLSTASEYITIIIPIIRVPATTDAKYLTEFGKTNNSQISISSIIPSGPTSTFAYYAACVDGIGLGTLSQNILNIVAVDGLPTVDITMIRIKTIFTNQTTLATYGGYVPPLSIAYSNTPSSLSNLNEFKIKVNSTSNISASSQASTQSTQPKEETIDAYKCVPFDPDNQIIDGKVKIDPTTGEVLSNIKNERDKLITDSKPTSNLTPSIYSKYVTTALAFFFTVIVIIIIMYLIIGATIGPSAVGHGGGFFNGMYKNLTDAPTFLIIGLLCGFIGFMIGMVLKYQT